MAAREAGGRDLMVGLFVLAGLAAVAYLSATLGGVSLRGRGGVQLVARFDEIGGLRKQIDILSPGQERRVTVLLKELTDIVPPDAHLTTMNLRNERLTLDGMARSASDLISALEKSKHFKNVTFTSPTTRVGDKERFALAAEVEK